jgi:hypothetical protein
MADRPSERRSGVRPLASSQESHCEPGREGSGPGPPGHPWGRWCGCGEVDPPRPRRAWWLGRPSARRPSEAAEQGVLRAPCSPWSWPPGASPDALLLLSSPLGRPSRRKARRLGAPQSNRIIDIMEEHTDLNMIIIGMNCRVPGRAGVGGIRPRTAPPGRQRRSHRGRNQGADAIGGLRAFGPNPPYLFS